MATSRRNPRSSRGRPGLPIPKPAKAWDRGLRPYLNACDHAYRNAVALKGDAGLLFRERRYARATAISITGLEEAGKALVFWLIGIGRVGESHRERVLTALRYKHTVKQATSLSLRVIGQVMGLVREIGFGIPKPKQQATSWPELEALLRGTVTAIVADVQTVIEGSGLAAELASFEQEADQVVKGSLESARQRALYTDLNGEAVRSPVEVKRGEAMKVLRDLRICLAALKPLAGIAHLGDEGMDAVLAGVEMQERLWQSSSGSRGATHPLNGH